MFRKELKEKLERIFQVKKVTFIEPDDHYEQDTMFVDIAEPHVKIVGSTARCRVTGSFRMYSQIEKLPYGFFAKKIELASIEDKKNFFFFEIDKDIVTSGARENNIHERKVNFIFSYSGQFDPNKGKITELKVERKKWLKFF